MSKYKKYVILSVFALAALLSAANSASAATCLDLSANIKYGEKSRSVTNLQNFLTENGFLKVKADGSYGPQTRAAVLAFQTSQGLTSNPPGFIGAGTRLKIKSLSCGESSSMMSTRSASSTSYAAPAVPVSIPRESLSRPVRTDSVSYAPGCSATAVFSYLTGERCVPLNAPSSPNGCNPGALYSSTTGEPCTSVVTPWQPGTTTLPASPFTVISPNGGESFRPGASMTITFNPTGAYGRLVKFDLVNRTTGKEWDLGTVTAQAKDRQSFVATVPWSAESGMYKIRASSCGLAECNAQDLSDGDFAITSVVNALAPSVTSLNKTAGAGGEQVIVYGRNLTSDSTIDFFRRDGTYKGRLTPVALGQNGTQLSFTLDPIFAANSEPGLYNLKVSTSKGTSNSIGFTILPYGGNATVTPAVTSVTLISPNGEEGFRAGDVMNIRWASKNPSQYVAMIALVPIDSPNSFTHVFTQGYCADEGGCVALSANSASFEIPLTVPSGMYKLMINCRPANSESSGNCNSTDYSDAAFKITASAANKQPVIRITSPNGGESVKVGQTYRITWDSTNVDQVTLTYSFGDDVPRFFAGDQAYKIPNIGYYDWNVDVGNILATVPGCAAGALYSSVDGAPCGVQTKDVKIRIAGSNSIGATNDSSDSFFTVSSPAGASSSPAVCTPLVISRNLVIGSFGQDVTDLKKFLLRFGFMPVGTATVGTFSQITKNALSSYQVSQGITPVDGQTGPITRAAIAASSCQ